MAEKLPLSAPKSGPQLHISTRTKPLAEVSSSNTVQSSSVSYGQMSSASLNSFSVQNPPQQIFPGGVTNSGLLIATPSSSSSMPSSLNSAMNIVSHDQDGSVFSPSSMDDERMKIIEKVSQDMK